MWLLLVQERQQPGTYWIASLATGLGIGRVAQPRGQSVAVDWQGLVNILLRLRARRQLNIISIPLSSGLLAPLDIVVIWVVMFQPLIGVPKFVDLTLKGALKVGLLPKDLGRTWTKGIS